MQRIPQTTGNFEVLDSYTKLLITGNNVINDATGKAVTVAGNTNISTAQSVIGGSSIYFDGSGDYITTPDSDDWDIPTNSAWTLDFWIRPADLTNGQFLIEASSGSPEDRWVVILDAADLVGTVNISIFHFSSEIVGTPKTNLSINQWNHVAFVRETNNNWSVYINGVYKITAAYSTGIVPTNKICIGTWNSTTSYSYNGYMSFVRVSKGIARWTSNFTPPSSVYDYFKPVYRYNNVATTIRRTVDSYTKLLITGNNVISDATGKAVTVVGNTAISTAQSIIGGSSIYFDGSGDYLSLADSDDWDFGTGDFTIDFFVYPTSVSSTYVCFELNFGSGKYIQLYVKINAFETDVATTTRNYAITANNWYHAAISRQGGTVYFFVNGDLKSTFSKTTDFVGTPTLDIGRSPSGYYFPGYLSHLRITKGIARWISNFIPPSTINDYYPEAINTYNAAGTSVGRIIDPYTKLLIPGNGSITDLTGKAVTVAGNTNISTAQSIIGGSSIYFDGSGDYLTVPDSDDWYFGTGDFTIDFWVRFSAISIVESIIGQRADGDNQWRIFLTSTNSIKFYNQVGGSITIDIETSASVIAINTWYHIALVRNGTALNMYIQGVSTANATDSDSIGNFAAILEIASFGTGAVLIGYLSHIRITKGIARWTSNFTPPSKLTDYYQMNNYIGA